MSNVTIKALVAAANLLALLGQETPSAGDINTAKSEAELARTLAMNYYSAANKGYYSVRAVWSALNAEYNVATDWTPGTQIIIADSAFYAGNYYEPYRTKVNIAYNDDAINLKSAFTCAAGLIYLTAYK